MDIGYFYICSSDKLQKHGMVKIGHTSNLKNRLSVYNCGRLKSEYMYYIFICKLEHRISFERIIKYLCITKRVRGEIFKCMVKDIIYIVNIILRKFYMYDNNNKLWIEKDTISKYF